MPDLQFAAGRMDQQPRIAPMTVSSAHVAVLNSLVFIKGGSTGDIPKIDDSSAVWSTASCVAVSCLPDCDGKTEIIIGRLEEVASESVPLFDGQLKTPSRTIIVGTVLGSKILEMRWSNPSARLKIWTNGARDTNKIVIGVSAS
jgi:hypothetical protein